MTVLIGMGGWSLPSFEGTFYPAKAGKGFRKLEYYSQFFDMVEVNATFYTLALGPQQVQRWIGEVLANAEFQFTAKLFQDFTHKRTAGAHEAKIVHEMLEPLVKSEKMGGLVLQFPHSFIHTKENREYLSRLSSMFGSFDLFLEVRHDSWNQPEIIQFLREQKFHLINVDLPAIKRHMPLTNEAWGDRAYLRLMGRNKASWDRGGVQERYKYAYSKEELEDFVKRIESLSSIAQKTFVVFHNDPNAHSAVNGFQLKHMTDTKKKIAVPESLLRSSSDLQSFAVPFHHETLNSTKESP